MPAVLATHGRTGGLILHRTSSRRGLTFRAAHTMTVSRATNGSAANGAGHAAEGSAHHGVLRFPRRNTFRTILSVDGGGLRGILPAGMLEGVEDVIKEMAIDQELVGTNEDNKPVQLTKDTKPDTFSVLLADYFDVCAGTSTGSIVATYVASKGSQATALHDSPDFATGFKTTRTVKTRVDGSPELPDANATRDAPKGSAVAAQTLFLSTCKEIFPERTLLDRWTNPQAIFRPKYKARYPDPTDPKGKELGVEHVLQSAFGEDVLMSKPGVLASSLVVTSYQLTFDRPFLFWASTKSGSGYAALRRTLAGAGEDDVRKDPRGGDLGFSDLVRKPQDFKLWQVVRASTAAPTFFPTAEVEMLGPGAPRPSIQLTDGGVFANNPSMLGLSFATTEYDTKFVAEEHSGKPSLAVLSLGCGTTSELPEVNPNAGAWGWAAKGPLIPILMSGGGELTAAIFQELSRDWPGSTDYQSLRLQLTAGYKDAAKTIETLSYSADVLELPSADGSSTGGREDDHDDVMIKRFQGALSVPTTRKQEAKQLKANAVLTYMDVIDQAEQLLGLGYAVVADHHVQDKLKTFVRNYVLADAPDSGAAAAARGAAEVAA